MRDIVWGLKNDDMMRQSPAEMLRTLAAEQGRQGLFRIRTRLTGLPEKLDGAAMRDLSLIVREAIGNAVKHGGARKIALTADALEEGGWMLRVANDGAPFDAASAPGPSEGHFGLEGMKERARRIGATLEIVGKGKWTVVIVNARARTSNV
jgi:signal transduction histidine kinase